MAGVEAMPETSGAPEGGAGLEALEAAALKDLLEVAVALKKSGILGILKEVVSNLEEALAGVEEDVSVSRLLILAGSVLEAARRLDAPQVPELKINLEDASYCLFNALSKTEPAKTEGKGLMGLLSALRDPDVQAGLGFLIGIAKNLGSCIRSLRAGGQQG
jgi:uncharacterized protein YjgD (DUF1641 family)